MIFVDLSKFPVTRNVNIGFRIKFIKVHFISYLV